MLTKQLLKTIIYLMPEETINATPITPQTPPVVPVAGTSDDTKTLVTILLLIFLNPVGTIVMWVWTKWKTWVKALVTCFTCLPITIAIIGFLVSVLLVAINPKEAINRANQLEQQQLQNSEQNLPLNNLPDNLPAPTDTNAPSY